jgi:hypothetical protein
MRKQLTNFVLTLVALCFAGVFLPIRDIEIVLRIKNAGQRLAMYDESWLCADIPTCYRVSHKVVISALSSFTRLLVDISRVGETSSILDLEPAREFSVNVLPFLLLRLLIAISITVGFLALLRSYRVTLLVSSVLMFWISGVPLRVLAFGYSWLRESLGLGALYAPILRDHISRQSTMYILEHDLMALALIVWIPLVAKSPVFNRLKYLQVALGFILGVTFENLPVAVAIGLLVVNFDQPKIRRFLPSLYLLIGGAVQLSAYTIYGYVARGENQSRLLDTVNYYWTTNASHKNLIIHLFIGFLGVPFFFGYLTRSLIGNRMVVLQSTETLRKSVNGIAFGLTMTYFVGYFTSGVASEFGRQSLGGQILLFLSGFLARQAREERRRLQNISNIDGEIKAIS